MQFRMPEEIKGNWRSTSVFRSLARMDGWYSGLRLRASFPKSSQP